MSPSQRTSRLQRLNFKSCLSITRKLGLTCSSDVFDRHCADRCRKGRKVVNPVHHAKAGRVNRQVALCMRGQGWDTHRRKFKEHDIERFEYAVTLIPAASGGFIVSCRDFSQLTARGKDVAGAMAQAAKAMETIFVDYMRAALRLPSPSPTREGERLLSPPAETVAKAALNSAMKSTGYSNVELAQRLGIDEKEVRRMRDPNYGSKLPRIAEAIGILGLRLVIGLETT